MSMHRSLRPKKRLDKANGRAGYLGQMRASARKEERRRAKRAEGLQLGANGHARRHLQFLEVERTIAQMREGQKRAAEEWERRRWRD